MRRVLPRRMGWVLVILRSGVGIPTNASIPAPIGDRLGVRRAFDSTLTGLPPIVHRLLGKARFGVLVGEASELFGRAGGGGRLDVLGDRPVELTRYRTASLQTSEITRLIVMIDHTHIIC